MLNLDRVGRYLCKIVGGKHDGQVVSIATEDSDDITKSTTALTIDGKFQQVPDPDAERTILYITGPSGSGKSTYTANYIKTYKKMYRSNEVYCFSALTDDESLDVIKPKRVAIDERLISEPLPVAEFADSLVVFDDIDVISDKKQREAVYSLLNQVLEVGRHHRISCIITNPLSTAGRDTRRVLNECHSITFFPFSGSVKGLKYLLTEYLGFDKGDFKKIKSKKSRWCTIFKNYPQVIMSEKDMWLPSMDDD
jgi:hypothetical protein